LFLVEQRDRRIVVPQPAALESESVHHHGGRIAFGPDRFLYSGMGDGNYEGIAGKRRDGLFPTYIRVGDASQFQRLGITLSTTYAVEFSRLSAHGDAGSFGQFRPLR
jgi:hypothetical protein